METANPAFARTLQELASTASSDVGLLFLGESGTGKEFLAREVHRQSPRHAAPFVAVNCAGLPRDLVESELFGHVAGAFTGAQKPRQGAFASAEGGTLLLDEIGDAPVEVQNSLLRALDLGVIKAVGADVEKPVNVRVLAATSRDLTAEMERGAFREDLYFRLAELVVKVPALRERREDLTTLAREMLAREAPDCALTDGALRALHRDPLRGNVRYLRNLLRRGAALVKKGKLDAEALGLVDPVVRVVAGTPGSGGVAESVTPGGRVNAGLETLSGVGSPVEFPEGIQRLAGEIWKAGLVVEVDGDDGDDGRNEVRAKTRAALLCLRAKYPLEVWPRALVGQYRRLFGQRWATTEGGRGVREVMRAMGCDPGDEIVRGWVVEVG